MTKRYAVAYDADCKMHVTAYAAETHLGAHDAHDRHCMAGSVRAHSIAAQAM